MSLTELKAAVDALSADELAELAAFIQQREEAAWNKQIDDDFAPGGRLQGVLDEVRADMKAGRLGDLP